MSLKQGSKLPLITKLDSRRDRNSRKVRFSGAKIRGNIEQHDQQLAGHLAMLEQINPIAQQEDTDPAYYIDFEK